MICSSGCPGINLSARDKAGLSPFAAAMTFKNNTAARVILELEPGAAEQPDSRLFFSENLCSCILTH